MPALANPAKRQAATVFDSTKNGASLKNDAPLMFYLSFSLFP